MEPKPQKKRKPLLTLYARKNRMERKRKLQ